MTKFCERFAKERQEWWKREGRRLSKTKWMGGCGEGYNFNRLFDRSLGRATLQGLENMKHRIYQWEYPFDTFRSNSLNFSKNFPFKQSYENRRGCAKDKALRYLKTPLARRLYIKWKMRKLLQWWYLPKEWDYYVHKVWRKILEKRKRKGV